MTSVLVLPGALFFLWMDATALRRPPQFLQLMDIQAVTVKARDEIRAVYGGLGLTMAGMLLRAACRVSR